MTCEDIGLYAGAPANFVEFVLDADPSGVCQQVRVGTMSPGPVGDQELLARFIFAPTHTSGDTGKVDETVVADMFKFGASVNRFGDDVSRALVALHVMGNALAKRIRNGSTLRSPQADRKYLGVLIFIAGEARAIGVDSTPARIRVYDRTMPTNRLHADLVANSVGLTKELKKELKGRLFILLLRAGIFKDCGQH